MCSKKIISFIFLFSFFTSQVLAEDLREVTVINAKNPVLRDTVQMTDEEIPILHLDYFYSGNKERSFEFTLKELSQNKVVKLKAIAKPGKVSQIRYADFPNIYYQGSKLERKTNP